MKKLPFFYILQITSSVLFMVITPSRPFISNISRANALFLSGICVFFSLFVAMVGYCVLGLLEFKPRQRVRYDGLDRWFRWFR